MKPQLPWLLLVLIGVAVLVQYRQPLRPERTPVPSICGVRLGMSRGQVEKLLGRPSIQYSDGFDYQRGGRLHCFVDYDWNQNVYCVRSDRLELDGQAVVLPTEVHRAGLLRQKLAERLGEPDSRVAVGEVGFNRYYSLKLQVTFDLTYSHHIQLDSSFAKPP